MKLNKIYFFGFAAAFICIMLLMLPVRADSSGDTADNFIADTSSAVLCSGHGDSFTLANDIFSASQISENSKIILKYKLKDTADDTLSDTPVLMKLCLTDGTVSEIPPAKFSERQATFTYEDIVASLGNADLSQVVSISFGDSGNCSMRCTALAVTNVLPAPEPPMTASETAETSLTDITEPHADLLYNSEAPLTDAPEPPEVSAVSEYTGPAEKTESSSYEISSDDASYNDDPSDNTQTNEFLDFTEMIPARNEPIPANGSFFDKFDKRNIVALYITLLLSALGALTIAAMVFIIIGKSIYDLRKGRG